ncbi:MAG: hypothetical protein EA383_07990 [Spirochaetaceae bacterium]|nr:MAG: hypothetical protein EA383_07990 [Spirochaetaceae bacterium]
MRAALKGLATLGFMSIVILTAPLFTLAASGEREEDVPSTAPASWSLPTFVIDHENGSAVLREYDSDRPETGALWNPERSEAQIRVGNRVFSLGDALNSEGTANVSGLRIQFGSLLQRVSADVSRVHVLTEFTNTSGRPRSFSLRYVLSPYSTVGTAAIFVRTRLPVSAQRIRTSFAAGTDRLIEREGDLVSVTDTDAVIALASGETLRSEPVLPLPVWPLPGGAASLDPEPAQFAVSNRDRLLQSPWEFRAARARDFTSGPGTAPDAAIGIRFHDYTLSADESRTLEFIVYVLHEPGELPIDDTAAADAAADTADDSDPDDVAEDMQEDVAQAEDPPPADQETRTSQADAPVDTETETETEAQAHESRSREAFEQLNQALSDLRTLQRREEAPSREELDEYRRMIEALRQELDNLRRSDSTE